MHDDRALPASGSCTGAAAIPCRVIHRLPLLECIGLLTAEDLEARLKKHKKDWNAYQAVLLDKACPNQEHHTPQSIDPDEWMLWSIEMHKTHMAVMCPGC